MLIYRTEDLPRLSASALAAYRAAIAAEDAKLWADFERTPCPDTLNAWRQFWAEIADPVVGDDSRRIVARAIERNGPGGVEV